MADFTYPSGIDSFVTIATNKPVPQAGVILGSLELGTGADFHQGGATGVVWEISTVSKTGSDMKVQFETSDDGTNWFLAEEFTIDLAAADLDKTFRIHTEPLMYEETHIRVKASTSLNVSIQPQISVKARLSGLSEVVVGL